MNLLSIVKQHKVSATFAVIAASLIATAVATRVNDQNQTPTTDGRPTVSLVPAADFARPLTIDLDSGQVESMKQADLKAQMTAQIVSVNAKLGDNVSAGQILVKLQDRDIAAQLEQAQAGLSAAQARLDELKRGGRTEDIAISRTGAAEAQTSLINSLKDTYAKSDDAIHNHIDKFFANPHQRNAEFLISVNVGGIQTSFRPNNDDLAYKTANQKYALEAVLSDWQKTIMTVTADSGQNQIDAATDLSKKNLQTIIDFMNTMAPLVNDLTTDNSTYKPIIDGYKTEFSAARGAVSGALAVLQGAQAAQKNAANALDLKLAGSSAEQIRQGQAAVEQAQAAVNALKATLSKTAIAAPISGKISYISGDIGELAAAGQLIASIVNPGTLQVKTYASENDLAQIQIGAAAEIDGGASGIVSNVSPAIDAQTKKAEVMIAINKNAPAPIIIGQSVSVKISAENKNSGRTDFLLPIQAVQFTNESNFVLTVNSRNIVETISVQTGDLIGENIRIVGGLPADAKIIPSVRGLKAGDTVLPQ